ncbi:hemolysin [Paracoccus alkanivorans]|uniref:Hemolysin n=2 Tax=Paracoccus alkanivorans TaxID=2116655 RepID=A0A3M0MGE8_9RHOB|nr:hemolysin [Paracoccus alkanivorans]
MEAKPIQALKLGTLSTATNSGLAASRDAWEYQTPCFTRGVAITVRDGQKPVEDLAVGDLVLTRDNGLQPIRWIGSRKVDGIFLECNPKLRPIRIRAGALGRNTPASDLIVSPQHRILVRSKLAQRMFGIDEVLVAARQLLDVDGIEIARDMPEVEYFHFMFDDHQLVLANGAETESLYAGPGALKAVGPAARDEILALFPELRELDSEVVAQPARPLVEGRTARHLIGRHALTGRELIS